jgi:hypothetical protein
MAQRLLEDPFLVLQRPQATWTLSIALGCEINSRPAFAAVRARTSSLRVQVEPQPMSGLQAPAASGAGAASAPAPPATAPTAREAAAPAPLALSFTGGKDCVLALHLMSGYAHPAIPPLPESFEGLAHVKPAAAEPGGRGGGGSSGGGGAGGAPAPRVALLVTFAPAPAPGEEPASSFKAHPIAVMRAQARALGLEHVVCEVGGRAPGGRLTLGAAGQRAARAAAEEQRPPPARARSGRRTARATLRSCAGCAPATASAAS